MSLEVDSVYEFGSFVLNPHLRTLAHHGQRVDISTKCFDLLESFVRAAGENVSFEQLDAAIWTDSATARKNITHHIARLRKTLGDNWRAPQYIRTLQGGRGYRFVAEVNTIAKSSDYTETTAKFASDPANKNLRYSLAAHIFIPVYLGPDVIRKVKGPASSSKWVSYKEFKIEGGRLCLMPSGIAVWHLSSEENLATLTEVAIWRKKTYESIFNGKHRINRYLKELIGKREWSENTLFKSVFGKLGYAYTAIMVHSPQWKDLSKSRAVLELLACLKVIEPTVDTEFERGRVLSLERQFLDNGLKSADMLEFGLAGEDLGFASWEGLAYYNHSRNTKASIENIIEFQIAVHSLWWLSKCLSDVWLADPAKAAQKVRSFIADLKRQCMIIRNIEAKETVSQRTMSEAVLTMNRVNEIFQETVELYR
jgi:DNA-binding winged helix-turn-helix (wHTH) protein